MIGLGRRTTYACCVNLLSSSFPTPALSFSPPRRCLATPRPQFLRTKRLATFLAMDGSGACPVKEAPLGLDMAMEEEYALQSNLLQEFTNISNIDKAWIFKSNNGSGSQAMFSIGQTNLLANKKRKYILSSNILKKSQHDVSFQWAPFPVEMAGVSLVVPSPSGTKLLVVRNGEPEAPTHFEIWNPSQLEKEFHIPHSVHGQVYADGWFEGVSWNSDETLIAYIAEEPSPSKPTFGSFGYKKGGSTEKDCGSWKGQGDWQENWGEAYAGKELPALFVINIDSGDVRAVDGIGKSLSVGQVVWDPTSNHYLVFVGWSADNRKLGIKYCYNRPCALYAVRAPFHVVEDNEVQTTGDTKVKDTSIVNLTQSISSAFFPRFSPDGKFLVFLSSKSSVNSGAHCATNSLHRIDWPFDSKIPSAKIIDVIPVVNCAEDGDFPGLYCASILSNPWLSVGNTMILSSIWGSTQVLLSVNVLSGNVLRISPSESEFSWNVLALDGDNIIGMCSSPIDVPEIKYGSVIGDASAWSWLDVSSPICNCSEKVQTLLSSLQFSIMKIPVRDVSENLTIGAGKPIEAIFVSSKLKKGDKVAPLIVILHGGPHSVSYSVFSKSLAFLSSIGFSLLLVNYRGSLGFGEEALQSLLGKIGTQDVNDVLTAVDHVIELGFANPSKIFVLGGSHGGFLTTHLIGQAPDKFVAAAVRNPVCNLALMVGTTDIPDWCYVEAFGTEGKSRFTEGPSPDHLTYFYNKSPVSHLSKVKVPSLFLLGAQDLRVPVSNGMQYARVLKENGAEVKVIVFPSDTHPIERPQSDFECFLNIGVWFTKYCK